MTQRHELMFCLALTSSCWILSACVSAPPRPAPRLAEPPPAAWHADPEATRLPADIAWWQAFGEPRLGSLIEEALGANPSLTASAAALDAARAQARIAGAELVPQASLGLDGARRQQVFVGLPIPGQSGPLTSRSTSFGVNLNVSWEADLWGRLRSGKEAARADLEAARADLAAAQLSLAGQVAKAWLGLIEAEQQLTLAHSTRDSRGRTRERVESRYRRGLAQPLDVRLARANEAQAEAAVATRERLRDALSRQLELLLGRYPRARLRASGETLPETPRAVPAGLPAELVGRRPDLLAAERRAAAAGWQVAAARAALYPRLTLTASGGSLSNDVTDLLDQDFSVWSLAGGLLQPLLQGGRLRAAVELGEASREAALARLTDAVLRAFGEVETALAADRFLETEVEALERAVDEARRAAKLAEDRYAAGAMGSSYLAILESQRQAFATESQLWAVRRQRLVSRVDLFTALGGGFGSRHAPSEPETETAAPHDTTQEPPR